MGQLLAGLAGQATTLMKLVQNGVTGLDAAHGGVARPEVTSPVVTSPDVTRPEAE
jgi:hypothetical protein